MAETAVQSARPQAVQQIRRAPVSDVTMEKILVEGDLSSLTAAERVEYVRAFCEAAGVNPLNRPVEFIMLDGKLVLYARRQFTDEIRMRHRVTMDVVDRAMDPAGEVYIVTAAARTPDGRVDTSTGAVPLVKEEIARDDEGNEIWRSASNNRRFPVKTGKWIPLNPIERANALMKAETKAKRRATLSLLGFGLLDESEIASIASARIVPVDHTTGEILDDPRPASLPAGKPRFADREAVNRAAHAFMESVGGNHSDLHNAMVALTKSKYQSMKDLPFEDYAGLLGKLEAGWERDQQAFVDWLASMREPLASEESEE